MKLSELKTGEKAVIVKVSGHGGFRKRIIEMGFVQGQQVEVLLNAPLQDPVKYKIMGYEVSLRRQEAEMIEVITEEEFGRHIWECVEWEAPFSQWLLNAGRMESRRQQYLQTDWHDAVSVSMLEGSKDEGVTFFFEGEDANDILSHYFQWLCGMYESQMKSIPGAKITNADRNYILSQETDIGYLSDELDGLDPEVQASFKRWMEAWEAYLTARLKPEEEIHFWNKEVPEEIREKLLDYLRLQEKQPAHYQALTSAVYALRQLGYVRYKLSVRSMRKWLSDYLSENYMLKNTSTQFDRAWKTHGRYTPEVQEQVDLLAEYGIKHL
jgi:Fe2+ transport system protein FeoA